MAFGKDLFLDVLRGGDRLFPGQLAPAELVALVGQLR